MFCRTVAIAVPPPAEAWPPIYLARRPENAGGRSFPHRLSVVLRLPPRLVPVVVAGCVAAAAIGTVAGIAACGPPAPGQAADAAWTTVGDAACASCHADIAATYARSGMGRAVSRFTLADAPERFDASGRSPTVCAPDDGHPGGGYCYEAFVRGDTLFQRETHPAEPGFERVYAASHVVGSGNATRSYLMTAGQTNDGSAGGGFVTEMPLTWYVERELWDLSPGYTAGNQRFERPITHECLTCHDAAPGHETSQNFYTDIPLGISCERCHGPGSAHVAAFEAGGDPAETLIVNPANLSTALQLDVCQQCHLTGETVFKPGEDPATYRPGRPLSAHRAVFVSQESLGDPEAFGIASHAERLAQSSCFEASLGTPAAMTCTTCHDPHVAQAELPADAYSAACRSCHTPAAGQAAAAPVPGRGPLCDRPGATTPALALSGDCASCHMRRAGTSDIPHVSFTDHWIRKNPPPARAGGPTETAETQTTPFTLVNVVLRESELERQHTETDPAVADAEAGIATFNVYDKGVRLPAYLPIAARLLRRGIAGGADRTDARIALGRTLAAMDSLPAAVAVLAEAVARDSSDAYAALWLGVARLDSGDAPGAAAPLRRAVRLAPRLTEARLKLAEALAGAERYAEAADALAVALTADPVRHAGAWNDLGYYRLQSGALPAATAALRRAVALDPRLQLARTNLGTALLAAGDLPAAAAQLEAALRLDPAAVAALGNLGVVRQRQGRPDEARRLFERVLALEPGSPQAAAALAAL